MTVLQTPGTHLVIIDPQNDFCDLPDAYRVRNPLNGRLDAPALPVAGAHADMQRLARFIERCGERLDAITVTLDSHHRYDIAHPTFWRRGDGSGEPVAPFTQITAAQARSGEFVPRRAEALPRALAYLDALEARGRYTLMVWPVHCEIGSWGHAVHADVRAAYNRWEEAHGRIVGKVAKGSNPWTEHYSAVQAEVPDGEDPDTQVNQALLGPLRSAGLILIAGEAGSHCVKATTEHLVEQLGPDAARRMVLLSDCMSPVGGFEAAQAAFFEDMAARGVALRPSTDVAL